jgi:ribonuclease PH
LLLEQFPEVEEDLRMQVEISGTKASAESIKEKRIRLLISNLSTEMQKILSSCILTENYPATTIAFQFTVLEMDSDLV